MNFAQIRINLSLLWPIPAPCKAQAPLEAIVFHWFLYVFHMSAPKVNCFNLVLVSGAFGTKLCQLPLKLVSKWLKVGRKLVQVGPKMAQVADFGIQSGPWEAQVADLEVQNGPWDQVNRCEAAPRRHQGSTEEAPRMHQGCTKDASSNELPIDRVPRASQLSRKN